MEKKIPQAHKKSYRRIKFEKSLITDNSLTAMEIAIIFKLTTKTPTFYPSIHNLAIILHASDKKIRTATDKLQKKGYLKIIRTPMGQHNIWKLSQTKEFANEQNKETESAE